MTTQEVADRLVALCRQGQFDVAMTELYHQDIESVEPDGAPVKLVKGIEAVVAKSKQWAENVEEIHSSVVSDPLVAGIHFSISMKMNISFKGMGRMGMEEICVYQVSDGKIIRENFSSTPKPDSPLIIPSPKPLSKHLDRGFFSYTIVLPHRICPCFDLSTDGRGYVVGVEASVGAGKYIAE